MAQISCLPVRSETSHAAFRAFTRGHRSAAHRLARDTTKLDLNKVEARSSKIDAGDIQQHRTRREALTALLTLAAAAPLLRAAPAAAGMEDLPKEYRELSSKLVEVLKESILIDIQGAEEREVRRAADPAKELVKSWVQRWRDDSAVQGEVSHREIAGTLRQLGEFYQTNGARARLPNALGEELLTRLTDAEAALPERPKESSLLDKIMFGAGASRGGNGGASS